MPIALGLRPSAQQYNKKSETASGAGLTVPPELSAIIAANPAMRAGHIVKNVDESVDEATALAAIQKAQEELKGGASFEELADRYSDCAGKARDKAKKTFHQIPP